jgi:TolA-binding protein
MSEGTIHLDLTTVSIEKKVVEKTQEQEEDAIIDRAHRRRLSSPWLNRRESKVAQTIASTIQETLVRMSVPKALEPDDVSFLEEQERKERSREKMIEDEVSRFKDEVEHMVHIRNLNDVEAQQEQEKEDNVVRTAQIIQNQYAEARRSSIMGNSHEEDILDHGVGPVPDKKRKPKKQFRQPEPKTKKLFG